jgi:hypothetical protein
VTTDNFPWGDRHPEGGYKIGDVVGLIYSDHENYIFDNPTGIVVAVDDDCEKHGFEHEDDGACASVTVQVEATVNAGHHLYLIERATEKEGT